MKKERKEKHFIKKPVYPGGQKALNAFIKKELKFPREALEQQIEGSVYLRYSINPKGKVIDTKVISSLGFGCDEEAIRVVKMLQFNVDKVFRTRVLFHKKIRVWFKKPKKVEQKTRLNYQIKPSPSTVAKSPSGGYNYTITVK